jgi:hypothetical protein
VAAQVNEKNAFRVVFAISVIIALAGWEPPGRRMPLDFRYMIWGSLPLAGLWTIFFVAIVYWFGRKAMWMLCAAPFAFYWPIWLLFNGIPSCHWLGNCA